MGRPMIAHRGKDMTDLLGRIGDPLKALFRTKRPVYVGSCSATGFMEMAVRSGVRPTEILLEALRQYEPFRHFARDVRPRDARDQRIA